MLLAAFFSVFATRVPTHDLEHALDNLEQQLEAVERRDGTVQRTLGGYPSRVSAPQEVLDGRVAAELVHSLAALPYHAPSLT